MKRTLYPMGGMGGDSVKFKQKGLLMSGEALGNKAIPQAKNKFLRSTGAQ